MVVAMGQRVLFPECDQILPRHKQADVAETALVLAARRVTLVKPRDRAAAPGLLLTTLQ
jgi:hypothetical protein